MHQTIPLVDIFAGPGGLSEGFSAHHCINDGNQHYPFKSILSAEKEESAYRTLRLRAFLRHFIYNKKNDAPPRIYIDYVKAQSANSKSSPALILEKILDQEELPADSLESFSQALPNALSNSWKNFSSSYEDELEDIIEALFHARLDAKHFELGGEDVEGKSGDITPSIENALEQFYTNDKPHEFILVGGPPCQAYSNAGRSRRSKSVKHYTCDDTGEYIFDQDPRATLYKEYLKVLQKNKPAFFVMENVRGMLSAKFTADDGSKEEVWKRVVAELHDPTESLYPGENLRGKRYIISSMVPRTSCFYNGDKLALDKIDPRNFLIRASDFGVPQHRDRVILLGIRTDLLEGHDLKKVLDQAKLPEQENHNASVGASISSLPALFSILSSYYDSRHSRIRVKVADSEKKWKETVPGLIQDIVDDIDNHENNSALSFASTAEVLDAAKNLTIPEGDLPAAFRKILHTKTRKLLSKTKSTIDSLLSSQKVPFNISHHIDWAAKHPESKLLEDWYKLKSAGIPELNHYARGHMDADLQRYAYCACYAQAYSELERELQDSFAGYAEGSPKEFLAKKCKISDRITINDLINAGLEPDHANKSSFVDRFKVQRAEIPSTTVTCHLAKDGHYYIHPDPVQCRSLTVREAARLQTFPDNYFFEGKPTQQRTQVGNAVPPYLAKHISKVVFDLWKTLLPD